MMNVPGLAMRRPSPTMPLTLPCPAKIDNSFEWYCSSERNGRRVPRHIESNNLPMKAPTGRSPILPSDPAYWLDTNANSNRGMPY